MISTIATNLTGLLRFSGRTSRQDFWPYAIVVFVLAMTVWAVPFMIAFSHVMQTMTQYAIDHPDQATITTGPGSYRVEIHGDPPPGMMAEMTGAMVWLWPIVGSTVVLLASAVTRRLHDSGRSGAWGLMPLPFLAFSLTVFPQMFAGFSSAAPNLGLFGLTFLSNVLYMAGLVTLIFMLCQAPTGDNRYGPALAKA